jgi:hypothetical protein
MYQHLPKREKNRINRIKIVIGEENGISNAKNIKPRRKKTQKNHENSREKKKIIE